MATNTNKALGIASMILAVVNGLALLAFAVWAPLARARFTAIFSDLGVELPLATRVLLVVPSWLFLLTAGLLLALLVVKELIPNKSIPLAMNLAWLAVGALVFVAFVTGLMLPMVTLIQALEGSGS